MSDYTYEQTKNPLANGGLNADFVDHIMAVGGLPLLEKVLGDLGRGIVRSLHEDALKSWLATNNIPYEGNKLAMSLTRRATELITAKDATELILYAREMPRGSGSATSADEELLHLASQQIDDLEARLATTETRRQIAQDQYARLLVQIAGHPNAKELRGVLDDLLSELQGTERPTRSEPKAAAPPREAQGTTTPPRPAARGPARPTAPSATSQDYFTAGKTAFAAQKYTDAASALTTAARNDPKNGWIQYYLGMTYHAMNRQSDARSAFTSAVKLRPAFATKDLEEAVGFIARRDYTKALWAVERASLAGKYCPESPKKKILETANNVGVAFKDGIAGKKDYAAAKRAFTAALSIDPAYFPAQYHLGTIAFMEKDYLTAERAFTGVLRTDANHKWAHYQLGRVYEQTNRKVSARRSYESAVRLGLSEARTALAKI